MKPDEMGQPTIIVPYPGPSSVAGFQDIFVYLRPETNGVIAESTILRVVKSANVHGDAMKLIFLANIPGEFIVENHIVEQFYSVRLHFAVHGGNAFTPSMRERFSRHFSIPFSEAKIYGAFRALQEFDMQPEELFKVWVAETDLMHLNGQIVKKIKDIYVVNYDIPALIHKNSRQTDIAVMIFRTSYGYPEVKALVANMHKALCDINILSAQFDASRAFHFSKGPLEQVMDGIAYLYPATGKKLHLANFTFATWLQEQGFDISILKSLLLNPIVTWKDEQGNGHEDNVFNLTLYDDYATALCKLRAIVHQHDCIHHGTFLEAIPI